MRGIDFQRSIDNPTALPDLIVRPFQWKGSVPFLRDFNRGASHNELGMQAVEVVGSDVDGDFDGVKNEMTIGDQTALAVYMAGQPRPTSLLELSVLGLIEPLPAARVQAIARGAVVFAQVGCASCHIPAMVINTPVFSEPSSNAAYRDGAAFPAGQNPVALGVDPAHPIRFDLTRDQPDNHITLPNGNVFNLGALRRDGQGRGIVELFGDLKRHEMGAAPGRVRERDRRRRRHADPGEPPQPAHAEHVPHGEPVGRRVDPALPARRPRHHHRRGDPGARHGPGGRHQRGGAVPLASTWRWP